ncbi:hypothetical protein A4H97_09820 [Niastella yeongjuensis]|uniref:Uncharacterized protein n=1 Tax=Niastella yeongjuensis TaxID=354355 RepID=A0A1V9EEV9_9BACT|nr:hypothetical protein [Niastella yeongjuensis]OQP44653.1 hypothetical protein A4H97_09820 [Niastella yeongjuensis]SEO79791.1 hypothetical protein SAMN05660816_03577 [Niastella yeongjuensis]
MATLISTLQITGTLDNLSYYKMRGSDKIIVRRKGGPSKNQVKNSDQFEQTRLNNKEFGGRSMTAKQIKSSMFPMRYLADHNIIGPLNALLKPIQELDTVSEKGEREVRITRYPKLLEGFQLNRRSMLESIVRTPVKYNIQNQQVIVEIPELIPGINFLPPDNYPFYQFIAITSMVPDVMYNETLKKKYEPVGEPYTAFTDTDWLPVNNRAAATQLIIDVPGEKRDGYTRLVTLGISVGTQIGTYIEPVKYVGAARIIGAE